jgi:aspartyl-tRNA(Asn)/glutamyl-tRNA(Gln) amidotransferase subunit A
MSSTTVATRSFSKARAAVENWGLDNARRPPAFLGAPRGLSRTISLTEGRAERGPIAEAVALLSRGETTSTLLVERSLAALERHRSLNPLAYVDGDGALLQARELDRDLRRGRVRGPLHGIPVTVKDIIDVEDMPTRAGSEAYGDLPKEDATAVELLRGAGAVVLGKATTHEFALGVTTPQARHPQDPERIPGGSSGGSAIAVSTGIGLASVGTDTRASIRIPPALTGTVGFRPTLGTVATSGVLTLSWTMDVVAPLASTVADTASLLDVLTGGSTNASRYVGSPVEGLSIGVPESAFEGCHPEVVAAVKDAVSALEALGAVVKGVGRPDQSDLDISNDAGLILSRCEAAAFHHGIGTDLSRCWPETRDQLTAAADVSAGLYLAAHRCRAQLVDELLAVFEDVDVLAMPTSPVPAPKVEDAEDYLTILSRNCIPWSFVGFPALSIPCRGKAEGLPVGLQLIAAPYEERLLVALGDAYESEVTRESRNGLS